MRQKLDTEAKREIAERLWEDQGAAIYRFALRLSGNRLVAEDLTSETILAVLESLSRQDQTFGRPYIFGIVVNKWRRIRKIQVESISDLIAADSVQVDLLMDMERAFRQLPRPLQEAFVLVKAEGFTSKEAADILRIPQGTVQARTHEAIHRMRGSLADDIALPILLQEVQL